MTRNPLSPAMSPPRCWAMPSRAPEARAPGGAGAGGGAPGPPLPWRWGIALLPSLTQLMASPQPPEHHLELLLAPLVATRVKLNRALATCTLPVAGPRLRTEAHQPISLPSGHESAEQQHRTNLVTGKQNRYMFSKAIKAKHYFFWVKRRQLMVAFGCRAPSPGFRRYCTA